MKYKVIISNEQELWMYVESEDIETDIRQLQEKFNWDAFDKYTEACLEVSYEEENDSEVSYTDDLYDLMER